MLSTNYRTGLGSISTTQATLAHDIASWLLDGMTFIGHESSVGTYKTAVPDDDGRFAVIQWTTPDHEKHDERRFHDPAYAALEFLRIEGAAKARELLDFANDTLED